MADDGWLAGARASQGGPSSTRSRAEGGDGRGHVDRARHATTTSGTSPRTARPFTIWEKYADSEATMTHFKGFVEKWAEPVHGVLEPHRFIVYGSPDDAVKEAIADWGPQYLGALGGFAR